MASSYLNSKLVRRGSAGLLLNGLAVLGTLIVTVYLSKILGTEVFGRYIIALSLLMIVGIVCSIGIPTFLIRELAISSGSNAIGQSAVLLRFSLWIVCCAILLVSFLVHILGPHLPNNIAMGIGTSALIFLSAKTLNEVFSGALIGLGEVTLGQFTQLVLPLYGFLGGLYSIQVVLGVKLDIHMIFAVYAGAHFFSAAVGFMCILRNISLKSIIFKTEPIKWRRWILQLLPLVLVNGLTSIQQNVVFLILGFYSSNEEVALYRVAERISAVVHFLKRSLDKVVSPMVAAQYAQGQLAGFRYILVRAGLVNLGYTVFVFLAFVFSGNYILGMFFGPEFYASLHPVLILLAGYLLSYMFGFNGIILTMTSHSNYVMLAVVLSVVIQLLLLVAMVGSYGALGAALSTSISIVIGGFMLWVFALKLVRINSAIFPLKLSRLMCEKK